MNDKDENIDGLRQKVMEVCSAAIERCHKRVFVGGNISTEELRSLMFVIRESWYIANEQLLQVMMGKMDSFMDEDADDIDDYENENEEDDGPPHPLK